MRPAILFGFTSFATLAALLSSGVVSCGGSSSETPWPAEPPPSMMGPPQELSPLPVTADEDAGARKRKE